MSPSYTRAYPLVAEKAKGMWVYDVDGNVFLDFTSGIAVSSTGHCHPRVVQSIKVQAEKLLHMSGSDFYYGPEIVLAEKVASLVPEAEYVKVYFGNSGAEAIENAIKIGTFSPDALIFPEFQGYDLFIVLGAITGMEIVQILQERIYRASGVSLRTALSERPLPVRILAYSALVFVIINFGLFSSNEYIYFQF